MRVHPQLCSRCSVASVRQEPRVLATAQSLDTRPDTSAHACGAVLFAGPASGHERARVLLCLVCRSPRPRNCTVAGHVLGNTSAGFLLEASLQGFFFLRFHGVRKRVYRVSFLRFPCLSRFRVCRLSRFGILCFYMSTVFGNESAGFLFWRFQCLMQRSRFNGMYVSVRTRCSVQHFRSRDSFLTTDWAQSRMFWTKFLTTCET
jgi:hypothetical protein